MASIKQWKINGTTYNIKATYDGAGRTISSYYLPLSGGTMTGTILFSAPSQYLRWTTSTTDNNSTGRSWYGIGTYTNADDSNYNWLNISNYWGVNITTRGNNYLRHNGYILLSTNNYTSHLDPYYVNVSGDTMSGGLKISGANAEAPLIIKNGLSNYREGLRIMPYGNWSDIVLGGNDASEASGTSANSWFIGNNNGSFYITRNGSNSGSACLCCTGNTWKSSTEIIVTNCDNPYSQFRMIQGNYGAMFRNDGAHTYLLLTNSGDQYGCWNTLRPWYINNSSGVVYVGHGLYGAVWNDYAEYRISDDREPGRVVLEDDNGVCQRTSKRLQSFAGVISDTFGFAEGKINDDDAPLAVAGRVLVYPYQDRNKYKVGDCVCAAPNGTVDIMTRLEVIKWPDRIVGTVSEIPKYERWGTGNVEVKDRIWIKVK